MSRKNSSNKQQAEEEMVESVEQLEDENKSIIMGIISQLTKGTDLSRVTLPTFVLEPRSMLEKFTDFMTHPDLLIKASKTTDPAQRFVEVCRFFLSGWHIIPKGVKKPYNPILGEFFRCRYDLPDGTKAYYIAEQVSHHPPITTYYYSIPEHGIFVTGEAHPKAKFLGNSAATVMKGYTRITFSELNNETYEITNPNVYARGILFGKMIYEMGDSSFIKCQSLGFVCELDFKTKGLFSGRYHSVVGKIKRTSTNETLHEISGIWTDELFIHKPKSSSKASFFKVAEAYSASQIVEPLENQEWNESRNLWSKVTLAIKARDMDTATDEKTFIENRQREETKLRQKEGIQWHPRFFTMNAKEEYEFNGSKGIDYKNLLQAKEHLEKQMYPHTANVAVTKTTPAATAVLNKQSKNVVSSEQQPIPA